MPKIIDRFITPAVVRVINSLTPPGSFTTHSGQTIGPESPFELVAFRAAINVLSQDVAALPLKLYRSDGKSREEVIDHPLAAVLRYAANDRMTSYEFRETQMVSLLHLGNSYAYKQTDSLGRVMALYPLRPDRMTVSMSAETGGLTYTYTPIDKTLPTTEFSAAEILHIKGLSSDGMVGRSPLSDFREKLGEIAATERMTQSFFGNGMKRGAVLKHEKTLSDGAYDRLKRSLEDKAGADKAWKVLLLEEGMDFSELTFSPDDAQMLDTRKFSVEDVCRIYNLPPYKLRMNEPGASSYASVDAQRIDYLISSLTPWLVRIEQAFVRSCLTPKEVAGGYFVEHNTRALLRSDLKSQAEALKIGREANWYSVNDCRRFLGENPIEDARADDHFAPVQFTVGSESVE